ncbi:hypothetical protein BGX34_000713 [Mortierella sp. NVP85]|nr:hypothetical protein BGX34_000713 [Mortierella sp. NVP85]
MSHNENTRNTNTVSKYHEDSASTQTTTPVGENMTNTEFFARLFSTRNSGWRDPDLWPRALRQQRHQFQHYHQPGNASRNETRLMIEGKYFVILSPQPEPESQAVVLYRPRASASIIRENASKAKLPPEVELPDQALESSIESSLLTSRAGSRGAVPMRPFVSSQYVGLSTANYFRRTGTTATTTTTMTQARPVATPRPREQQPTRGSSSNVQPSRTMPIQVPSMSTSHQRCVDHRDPEETSQSRPMREPTRQVHHDAGAPAALRVKGREHTVLDLAEYALAHNLMDHELFMVLHKRAVKELVRDEHKERFNALMDQFYGPYGDSELSKSEVVPVQTLARATPAPTRGDLNQAQRQPQQPRREVANQDRSRVQRQVRKRAFDQLDFISPGRVVSMKRTRTEYYSPSDHPRR